MMLESNGCGVINKAPDAQSRPTPTPPPDTQARTRSWLVRWLRQASYATWSTLWHGPAYLPSVYCLYHVSLLSGCCLSVCLSVCLSSCLISACPCPSVYLPVHLLICSVLCYRSHAECRDILSAFSAQGGLYVAYPMRCFPR
jgi:hypothetical protein